MIVWIHGGMKYSCPNCGEFWIFLEKGIEDPHYIREERKPAPFAISSCPQCHKRLASDISGYISFMDGGYRKLPMGELYFRNDPDRDCGVTSVCKEDNT